MIRYAILAAGALALAVPTDADACGGFFPRRAMKTVPSLQVEQVLVIHDPVKEEEHFIRQLVFRDAAEPFGFVVPTPSQPTVAKVEGTPFTTLTKRFPPEKRRTGLGAVGGGARGGGGGGGDEKVTVLSQKRIGSFTAFTLAATDAGALQRWLDENDFGTTPESNAWLDRYVRLGFFYSAFRYEPAKKKGDLASETVRITFATPAPFYPYAEPRHVPAQAPPPRVLVVWVATPERIVPVSSHGAPLGAHLEQPWLESWHFKPTTPTEVGELVAGIGPLLPRSEHLVVQAFEDQKVYRNGWGDVVMVPEDASALDPARRARITKLGAALEADR